MEIATIKQILKDNVESLRGKSFEINNVEFSSLKEFGAAILKKEQEGDFTWSIELCINHNALNFGTESSVRHCMGRNFETLKIFANKIRKQSPYVAPTHEAIKQFGTNV